MNKRPIYKIYEISKQYKEHGKLLKKYLDKRRAENFCNKSIYRYIKEDELWHD